MSKSSKNRIAIALILGFLLGVLWFIGVRFITYSPDEVHYHANFALYINGTKEEFDSFAFYEEVQSCGADASFNPRNRVHMHDNINHVVHVHDAGATWGHLFSNLGFVLGDSLVQTGDGLYAEDEQSKLRFILNGKEVAVVANQTIRDEDTLLIDYGETNQEELNERYENITKDAAEYNKRDDPSSCSGGKPASFTERLKAAIGFRQ